MFGLLLRITNLILPSNNSFEVMWCMVSTVITNMMYCCKSVAVTTFDLDNKFSVCASPVTIQKQATFFTSKDRYSELGTPQGTNTLVDSLSLSRVYIFYFLLCLTCYASCPQILLNEAMRMAHLPRYHHSPELTSCGAEKRSPYSMRQVVHSYNTAGTPDDIKNETFIRLHIACL